MILHSPAHLHQFVVQSNAIENINGAMDAELAAHDKFLRLDKVEISDLVDLVAVLAPGKPLRAHEGMDVQVGNHFPHPGGPKVVEVLGLLLRRANTKHAQDTPFRIHRAYESLHPFMDGNGRSGRALWLWQMIQLRKDILPMQYGFLRAYYYQSLADYDYDLAH